MHRKDSYQFGHNLYVQNITKGCTRLLTCVALSLTMLIAGEASPVLAQPNSKCQTLADSTLSLFNRHRLPVQKAWHEPSEDYYQSLERAITAAEASIECFDGASASDARRMYYVAAHSLASLKRFDDTFDQYESYFDRYGEVPESFTDSIWASFMHESRGYVYYWSGNLMGAINDYSRALQYHPRNLQRAWVRRNYPQRVNLQHALCIIYERLNDLDAARAACQRAERMLARIPDPSGDAYLRERVTSLLMQGDLTLSRPDPIPHDSLRNVLDLAERARRIAARMEDAELDADLASAHLQSAQAYRHLDSLQQALDFAAKTRRIGRQSGDRTDEGRGALEMGRVRAKQGAFEQASEHMQEALGHFKATNHLDHQQATLYELGRLFEQQSDWVQASAYFEAAIDVIEEYRKSLTATEWSLLAFDEWQDPYHGLVYALIQQQRYEDALYALERSRAQHLHDLRTQTRITRALPPAERLRYDSLTTQLARVQNRLDSDLLSDDERRALKQQQSALVARRRGMLDLEDSSALPPLAQLQKDLRSRNQVLISYYVPPVRRASRAPSYAFVLTPDTLRLAPLQVSASDIETLMQDVTPILADGASLTSTIASAQFDLDALHRLYQRVFAPLTPYLPEHGALTIVPDGPLFRLPFGMLVTEPTARFAHAEASYLIQKHPITVDLSASLLTASSASDVSYSNPLTVLGRTQFARSADVPAVTAGLLSNSTRTLSLPDLPGVRRELRDLRRLFPDARVYLNKEAQESKLFDTELTSQVLHLASHALIYPETPLRNAFILTPDPEAAVSGWRDGLLHVHELHQMHRSIPLVVLSGCSTARGVANAGEGMRGLQYAFRAVGAESTLSFLWAADDDAASFLTSAFYRHMKNGSTKDVALQQAQLDYLEQHPDRSSPFFWAPFTLYGTPRSLSIGNASAGWLPPWPLTGLLTVALGAALFAFTRSLRYSH